MNTIDSIIVHHHSPSSSSAPPFRTPFFPTDFGFHYSLVPPQPQQHPHFNTQPLPFSLPLPDRDFHAIINAYKDEPRNPIYAFKHLLFSVTEPLFKVKPAGVSDIMWAEAMRKLEGMESADKERLWPQLVQGFEDLSQRVMNLASSQPRKHDFIYLIARKLQKQGATRKLRSKEQHGFGEGPEPVKLGLTPLPLPLLSPEEEAKDLGKDLWELKSKRW